MTDRVTSPAAMAAASVADRPQSVWQLRWRRLRQNRAAMAGGLVLILLALAIVILMLAGINAAQKIDARSSRQQV